MPTSPRPCHSHASDRVTGVGIRPSEKGNGLPRRFAPRNDKVRRGERLCPPEQREALSFRASDRVTGVVIRFPLPPSEREVSARSADGGRDDTRFLSPSRPRRQPPPRGGLTARRCRADGTASPTIFVRDGEGGQSPHLPLKFIRTAQKIYCLFCHNVT